MVTNDTGSNMPAGAGRRPGRPGPGRAGGARGGRGLPAGAGRGAAAGRRGPAQPVPRTSSTGPTRCACWPDRWRAGPGRVPADHGGGQRRRPVGRLGGRRGAPGGLGGRRPAVAGRRRGLPGLRGPDPLRRRDRDRAATRAVVGPVVVPVRLRPARARRLVGGRDDGATDVVGIDDRRHRSTWPCRAGSTRPTRPWRPPRPMSSGSTRPGLWRPWPPSTSVAGRFTTAQVAGVPARLLLAKNPAGWSELLDLVSPGDRAGGGRHQRPGGRRPGPVVVVGRATSNSWRAGRWWPPATAASTCRSACTTPRSAHHDRAPTRSRRWPGPAGTGPGTGPVDFIGNYTAFHDLLGRGRAVTGTGLRDRRRSTPTSWVPTATGATGVVLARRAAWRGIDVELVQAPSDRPLPDGRPLLPGRRRGRPPGAGGRGLVAEGTLVRAVADGAVVLAVCAGFQIVGRTFPAADGRPCPGVGLLDVTTVKGPGPGRSVRWWPSPTAAGPAGACPPSPGSRTTAG